MAKQTKLGKAFEFACLRSLYNHLQKNQEVIIEDSSALDVAKNFYEDADDKVRQKMNLGADAAVRVILRLEPQLENPLENTPLYLAIQEDAVGIVGDVRDVLCIRKQNEWEVGLSCKHNHSAVKHSRLSQKIDFGSQWFDVPCSQTYFDEITPLFEALREMKIQNKLWRDVRDKEKRFYIPLLNAFISELKRLDELSKGLIPQKLLQYLLGRNDFYKIITRDSKEMTQLQAFNLNNTLNRNAGKTRPQTRIQQLNMPSRFFDISFKPGSKNTIHVTCDGGWTISMRIHNASSKVEPSLKFDVGLIGIPPTLYTHYEPWD